MAPAVERALDRGVGLAGHQPAESVILSGMPGIDGVGLVLVDHAGHPFHVDGDVDPHTFSRDGGRPAHSGPRGRTMRGWTHGLRPGGGRAGLRPAGGFPDQQPAGAGPAVHRLALRQPVREAVGPVLARHAPDLRQRRRSRQLRRAGGHPARARAGPGGREGRDREPGPHLQPHLHLRPLAPQDAARVDHGGRRGGDRPGAPARARRRVRSRTSRPARRAAPPAPPRAARPRPTRPAGPAPAPPR